MQLEYERTYLAKYLPLDLNDSPHEEYLDIYIPQSFEHPKLRIRKRGNSFEITKKYPNSETDSSIQEEHTIIINNEEFTEFESNLSGKRAKKHRYYYKYLGIKCEIDIYQGDLLGLVLVDFEFENENDKNCFIMPDFCLAEVTQNKTMAGGMIVGRTYNDIKQFLENKGYKPLYQ